MLETSEHAHLRMSQRNMRLRDIAFIMAHGRAIREGNDVKWYLPWSVEAPRQGLYHMVVVTTLDGCLKTVWYISRNRQREVRQVRHGRRKRIENKNKIKAGI